MTLQSSEITINPIIKEDFYKYSINKFGDIEDNNFKKTLDKKKLQSPLYYESLLKLNYIDQGGFEHGSLPHQYAFFQQDKRFSTTRLKGWQQIFGLIFNQIKSSNKNIMADFLAGGGTSCQRITQLFIGDKKPSITGIDVSKSMVQIATENKYPIFLGSCFCHPFKRESMDASFASYGVHHVPLQDREEFVRSMIYTVKPGGVILLHDFEEKSIGARWYSELIHTYRPGHDYKHFSRDELYNYFKINGITPYITKLYDPFYLEGNQNQSHDDLFREFAAYLICLFSLKKLLPPNMNFNQLHEHKDREYWLRIKNILLPYLSLSDEDYATINKEGDITHPQIREVKISLEKEFKEGTTSDGKPFIIAPRASLIAIGKK